MKQFFRVIQRSRPQGRLEYYKLTLPPELIQCHIDAGRTDVVITEHMDGILIVPVTPQQVAEMKAGR